MKLITDDFMEVVCGFCRYPFILKSQEDLDTFCDACPIAAKVAEINAEVEKDDC